MKSSKKFEEIEPKSNVLATFVSEDRETRIPVQIECSLVIQMGVHSYTHWSEKRSVRI